MGKIVDYLEVIGLLVQVIEKLNSFIYVTEQATNLLDPDEK